MESKTRLSSYCTKQGDNTVNLVTSRKTNARLARPIQTLQPTPSQISAMCFLKKKMNAKLDAKTYHLEVSGLTKPSYTLALLPRERTV